MQILELNDQELTLYDLNGDVIRSEPAAVTVVGGDLVFGDAALAQSRISPQTFNNRYLGSATAQPLPSPIGPAHNFADLIFHHLASYPLTGHPLAILTPAYFTNEQLGLLLGICQELKVEVSGFIDLPLLQSLGTQAQPPFNVLDVEWHRMTLTRIDEDDGQAVVADHRVWEGRGINHLIEGWMGVIADEFMQRTRFDPLHRGDTEQQVFQHTYGWLRGNPDSRVVVHGTDSDRELDIQRDRLQEKTQQRLNELDLDITTPLYLSPRASQIPDIEKILASHNREVGKLANRIATESSLRTLCEQLTPDRVIRLNRTRLRSDLRSAKKIARSAPAIPATHLLDAQHHARPVTDFPGIDREIAVGSRIEFEQNNYVAIKVD